MDNSIAFSKKYLEDILSFFGVNITVDAIEGENAVIELHVPSTELNGFLIGQRGDTLRSLQHLVSSALAGQGHENTRVSIDVADYKRQQADRLTETARTWITRVQETGEDYHVHSMNAADRRIVHKAAQESGITSESVGEGRDRHIVLRKA